jgi:HEAT repeat protein
MLAYEGNEKAFAIPADFPDRLEKSLLASPDNNLQAAALSIFARLGAKEKLPLLRSKLTSNDLLIRRVAIAAIGDLGEPSDLELLRPYKSDPDKLVATAARSALERLQAKKQPAAAPAKKTN